MYENPGGVRPSLTPSDDAYGLKLTFGRCVSTEFGDFIFILVFLIFADSKMLLAAVHKRFRGQGEGVCPVRTFYGHGRRELFRCGRPYFLMQKHRIYRNLWCVRTEKGLRQCGQFSDKGSIFHNFVRTSFMDGPLSILMKCRTFFTSCLSKS